MLLVVKSVLLRVAMHRLLRCLKLMLMSSPRLWGVLKATKFYNKQSLSVLNMDG